MNYKQDIEAKVELLARAGELDRLILLGDVLATIADSESPWTGRGDQLDNLMQDYCWGMADYDSEVVFDMTTGPWHKAYSYITSFAKECLGLPAATPPYDIIAFVRQKSSDPVVLSTVRKIRLKAWHAQRQRMTAEEKADVLEGLCKGWLDPSAWANDLEPESTYQLMHDATKNI